MTMEAARLYAEIGIVGMPAFEAGMNRAAMVTEAGSAKIDASTLAASGSIAKMTTAAEVGFARAGKSMELMAGPMMRVGRTMLTHVTLPIVAIAAESTKMALTFNRNLSLIQTQAHATASEVLSVHDAILKMAGTRGVAQGPNELATAMYHIESTGIRGAKALDALHTSALLATVGNSDLDSATYALSATIASGIGGFKNFSQAAGILNAVVGAGDMRMQDLTASLATGVLPVAAKAGISLQQLGAALATMTDAGTRPEEAMTRLRMSINLLSAPSGEAEKQLKKLGIGALDLGHMMHSDGPIAALDLLKRKLDAYSKDPVVQQNILTKAFGGGKSSGTIVTLLGSLNTLDYGVKAKMASINAGQKSFSKDVTNTQKNMAVQMKQSQAEISASMIDIGEHVMPIAAKAAHELAGSVKEVTDWFDHLSPAAQNTALEIAGITAVVAPALMIMGNMARAALALGAAYQFVTGSATEASVAQTAEAGAATAAGAANFASAAEIRGAQMGMGSTWLAGSANGGGRLLSGAGAGVEGAAVGNAGAEAGWAGASMTGLMSSGAIGATGAAAGSAGVAALGTEAVAAGAGMETLAAGELAASAGAGGLMLAAAPLVGIVATLALGAYAGKMAWDHYHTSSDGAGVSTREAHTSMKDLAASAPALANALSSEKATAHESAAAHKDLAKQIDNANQAAKEHPNQGPHGPDRKGHTADVSAATDRAARAQAAANNAAANAKLAEGLNVHNLTDAYAQLAEEKLKASQLKGRGGDGSVGIKNINDAIRTQKDDLQKLDKEYLNGSITSKQFAAGQSYIKNQLKQLGAEKGVDLGRIADAKAKIAELRTLIKNMAGIEVAAPGVAKAMLQDMSAAERRAAFGTANINKILAAIASGKPSPNMARGMALLAKQIAAAVLQAATDSNRSFETMITGLGGVVGAANRASTAIANMGKHPMGPMPGAHAATGGLISGPGTGTSDSIPAMLSDGEYVINAKAAGANRGLLDAINSGDIQGFSGGGHAKKGKKKLAPAERRAAAIAKGDNAWQALQGSFALKEVKDQDVLVKAQQRHSVTGERKAESVLAQLYGKEIGKYRGFLSHHPGKLSASTQAGVWQAITSARTNREQALGASTGPTASDDFAKLQDALGLTESRDQAAIALAQMNGTDPALAQAALTNDYRHQVAKYQGFLTTHPGLDSATEMAVEQALASSAQNVSQAAQAASAPTEDQAAQLAQMTLRASNAEANYNLSQAQYGALNSSNDIGYGGGRNALQAAGGAQPTTVNYFQSLVPADPRSFQAVSSAANIGNSSGLVANQMYSGSVVGP